MFPQEGIWNGFDASKTFQLNGATPLPLECRESSMYGNILRISDSVAVEACTGMGDFIGVEPWLKVSDLVN